MAKLTHFLKFKYFLSVKSCRCLTTLSKAYTLRNNMIKEGKKIRIDDIPVMLSKAIDILSKETLIICLYVFGNLASGTLKPLSDLDFGVLFSYGLNRDERFRKHLELIGILNKICVGLRPIISVNIG